MGVSVGNLALRDAKIGGRQVYEIYLGDIFLWPQYELKLDELKAALSCISLGEWIDIFPWKDELPWADGRN